ncbi:MAG: hypothetical protein Q8934_03680 [Bacillota bacterium]|nr:hypothetical protein [Bacillota bacterium]
MYVIASFEHSFYLEMAINELEGNGINKDNIFAIPLTPKVGQRQAFDTIHHSDGISLMDGPAIIGTLLAVVGATYGYILRWGPVIWGLIGLAIGFIVGFAFKLLLNRGKLFRKKTKGTTTEVVLMINCYESQAALVEKILYNYYAIGVAKINQS